jgi:hypothetical protein
MPLPLVIVGKLQLPLEEGQQPAPIDLSLNMTFTEKVNEDRVYSAAIANDPVSLGTMANGGARFVLVKSPIGGCSVAFNGAATGFPAPPGGYFLWADPLGGFIKAMAITTTGPAKVTILAVA